MLGRDVAKDPGGMARAGDPDTQPVDGRSVRVRETAITGEDDERLGRRRIRGERFGADLTRRQRLGVRRQEAGLVGRPDL